MTAQQAACTNEDTAVPQSTVHFPPQRTDFHSPVNNLSDSLDFTRFHEPHNKVMEDQTEKQLQMRLFHPCNLQKLNGIQLS